MPSLRKIHRRHAVYYAIVIHEANDLYLQGGDAVLRGLALFDLEWPNIQAGQAWAAAYTEHDDKAATACNWYAGQWSVFSLRLLPHDYVRWLESALVAARQLKNRQAEGASLGNMGNAYADLGDARRAIQFYEQRLVIAREIGDRRGEGNTLFNMSLSLDKLGDRAQAIANAQVALNIYEQIESPYADRVRQQLAQWGAKS